MKTIIFGILLVIASSMRAQVEPPSFAQINLDLDSIADISMEYNHELVRKEHAGIFRARDTLHIDGKHKSVLNKYFIKGACLCTSLGNCNTIDEPYIEPKSVELILKRRIYIRLKRKGEHRILSLEPIYNSFWFDNCKYVSMGVYPFLQNLIKVAEFYKNKAYVEPTDVIKRYAKKKILIEYSDSLGNTTSCTISGKQIAFGNKKVKDAKALKFCLTRLDDLFFNGNDMAQFYHIENKIKPEGKLSITVDQKDSTEILMKDKVIDADRVLYNEKLYELINYIGNSQCRFEN